jgi:hypothetical protein
VNSKPPSCAMFTSIRTRGILSFGSRISTATRS